MKKLMIALLLVMSFTAVHAQKGNVSKAKNKVLVEENPDFAGARVLIKEALANDLTKDQANTWYVAGLIGYQQNQDFEKQAVLGKEISQDTIGQVVMESYNYLIKADELDQLPNEKGKVKPKHRRDIKKMIKEYYKYNFINYGAHLFGQQKYDEALSVFNVYLGVPDLPLIENEVERDSTYDMINYFAAISATNAGKSDEAIALYERLKDKNYETVAVYQLLAEEYMKKNDTANYVLTLEEAVTKFPQEIWFVQNLINQFILSEETDEALTYLEKAILANAEKNDALTQAQFYFVKGGLLESIEKADEAIEAYNQAIALDPTLAGAYEALGRMHYNKAILMADDKSANAEFKEAIPYYEKAVELAATAQTASVLRNLYYRLGMDAQYEELNKKMKVEFPELYRD